VHIRRAGPDDLEAIGAIERGCFDEERYPRRALRAMLSWEGFTTFLAEGDGPLGSATLYHRRGEDAQVVSLGVLPEHRDRGIATALMDAVEDAARASGARRVVLQVGVQNVAAMNLYLRRGYALRGILRDYYGRRKDAYLMEKMLEGAP
jgi:ribosomal-protein-alanine N-acetyltransferase